ncbi:MAG: DUF3604 domain-containing protein [Pseudomonadales bacterium]
MINPKNVSRAFVTVAMCMLLACGGDNLSEQVNDFAGRSDESTPNTQIEVNHDIVERSAPAANPTRNAYYGDLHVHTEYSFDAYSFGTTATPYDAYRYAKGAALTHPRGYKIQLKHPLDFYAVTDHAMFLGVVKEAADTSSEFSKYPVSELVHNINAPDNLGDGSMAQRLGNFAQFIPGALAGLQDGSIDPELTLDISKQAWLDTINAADQFNDPGRFTTFAAYEYTTSSNDRGNLHRNVIFKGTDKLPAVPFSRFNSQNPEGLWDWMDNLRDQGVESLAIPHNSNGSNGQMFKLEDWAGNPLTDDYAEQRIRNEPLVEITQIKGTSDTHPQLSPADEWADFEIYPYRVGTTLPSEPKGGYVREALLNGLSIEEQGGVNPYRFGMVAASDTHVAATTDDEETFFSKAGVLDGTPQGRGSVPASFVQSMAAKVMAPDFMQAVDGRNYFGGGGFESWSASGIAAVWAEENTRDSIYAAFRRKETFATTGPRIKLRFFAGDYSAELLVDEKLLEVAYARGVPMGSDLASAPEGGPRFVVWATASPDGALLQRAQIIKGYLKDGKPQEQIYDVACSDGLQVDPATGRCPDNGASVDLSDCSVSQGQGAGELRALWQDPNFDPEQTAFYYVRVLENPTCRWSTWDALRAGVEPRSDLAKTLQERAWSSPIWYRNSAKAAGQE